MENVKQDGKKKLITQEQMMEILDSLFEKCTEGIPVVSPSVGQLAADYLKKNPSAEDAAKSMIKYQVAKCTTSGFVTGLGGLITLPAAIPANMGPVWYIQVRMIACTAYLAGYDIKSDQIKTIIFACLAGVSINEILKKTGVKIGEKVANNMLQKLPGTVLVKINQRVGFRLVTKFGQKGAVNLVKAVPVVGGVINGGLDLVETKIIGNRAYKMFFEGNFDTEDTEEVIDYEEVVKVTEDNCPETEEASEESAADEEK